MKKTLPCFRPEGEQVPYGAGKAGQIFLAGARQARSPSTIRVCI